MKPEHKLAIKSMVYAQAFVETLDAMQGNSAFVQAVRKSSQRFNRDVDKFLNIAYCGGDTETIVLELLEEAQNRVDAFIDESVEVEE